ncbi:MAG: carboxylating nicotinate-nucleotide diphosphorylase [Alphaproteobacteria bacterium]|nr:carboxylating nicotinate-nucleotide diphosphorylase [Alphaproteobacteria bacterium]
MTPLPDILLRPIVETALREDLGRAGDLTTDFIVPSDAVLRAAMNARQQGIVAGMDLARLAFTLFDPSVSFSALKQDGEAVHPGDCLVRVEGPARSLLSSERTALNLLSHLSGIASETNKLVNAVSDFKAHICDTRKTTPGLRLAEKYAVRAGGGLNHRFGLDDAVLIKDNHIAVAGGILPALERVHKNAGHLVKIEIEVDTLAQLDQILALQETLPVDAVLLDNMPAPLLEQAVGKVGGLFLVEASGGITLQNVKSIAATGVDLISVGWITHSAPTLDIGLDIG